MSFNSNNYLLSSHLLNSAHNSKAIMFSTGSSCLTLNPQCSWQQESSRILFPAYLATSYLLAYAIYSFLPKSFPSKVLPLHLYMSDGSILKCYFSPVQNAQGFHLEIAHGFHLHQVPINHMSRVMNILFKKKKWNTLWILRLAGSARWYPTSPIRVSI